MTWHQAPEKNEESVQNPDKRERNFLSIFCKIIVFSTMGNAAASTFNAATNPISVHL